MAESSDRKNHDLVNVQLQNKKILNISQSHKYLFEIFLPKFDASSTNIISLTSSSGDRLTIEWMVRRSVDFASL